MLKMQLKWASIVARWGVLCLFALLGVSVVQANTLQDVKFAELPGERFEVRMDFSSVPSEPTGYTIEQPARIVLDFPSVENALTQRKFPLSFGNAKSAVVLSSNDRTRLILNLQELTVYTSRVDGNAYLIEVGAKQADGYLTETASIADKVESTVSDLSTSIANIDFRRGEQGEGKIIVELSDPGVDIDVKKVSSGVVVNFNGVQLPQQLRRNLDVIDFATPVSMVKADYDGADSTLEISAAGDYDYLAYQADNEYVISVKPLTLQELEEKKARFSFVGEKLSLNFQNIEVRSVLQLIADFTELNLVASDTVTGSITLRLENVPWDQALDLVLKAKGLDKRQVGNVLMVAPAAEIAERERQELETQKQLQELAPLRTEFIRLRYASAENFLALFKDSKGEGEDSEGILSERGTAIVDPRTNSIVLTETEQKITEFKELIKNIDVPIRQVMIESRIVIANTDFRKELGVRWAGDYATTTSGGNHKWEGSGRLEGIVNNDGQGPEGLFIDSDGDGITDDERSLVDSSLVDLGVAGPTGSLALNFVSDNILLGLELSALQTNGYAEIVSQPKVITGDKQIAHIESGTEIPYLEASSSGATSVSFKEAVLKLEVTPQITPDDQIIMKLKVNQDSVGEVFSDIPSIDVTELQTQVLVGNGQTVVLGGIFQTQTVTSEEKVPFLGDLPYLGRLFRKDINSEDKRELLIFITPKILADQLAN
ncbi:type 4a pilus secretin PilQ [Maricurvus nonylphenolicus]|uniref:type IV pilus secretin PilQ n=1 Tax=Maricurvus nonylphenolicus TaxID=1008307 RepID=UPI0036F3C836